MTLAFDVTTENVTTGADPHTASHAAAASNVRAAVVLYTSVAVSTDIVVGVTYGGTAMTRVRTDADTATEPGRTYAYFLGALIPQGTQTVSVDRSDATTDAHLVVATWTGADDTEVVDHDGLGEDRANPSVTLQFASRECVAVAMDYTGGASPATAGTGCTLLHTHDFTAFGSAAERITTPQTADFAIAVVHGNDDCAFSAFAFAELVPPAIQPTPPGVNMDYAVERSFSW